MTYETPKKTIASVEKAAEVLRLVARTPEGLGATELSRALGGGVSATYHLVNTLRFCGMLEQDRHTKKFRIGFGLLHIASLAKEQNLLGSLAQPVLDALRTELGETTSLAVLDGDEIICVARAESTKALKIFAEVGARTAFHFTSGGKLLMAYAAPQTQEEAIARVRFERYTPSTIVTEQALRDELTRSRARGYGVDDGEHEEGVTCVAVPVFDRYGDAAAAISASGPTARMREQGIEEIAAVLRTRADALSAELGYRAE
ncbi:MAG: IclR family transcriptional regulator [Clostridia bacterium]|nr:IclR family transcriptional regulator [Clostridia bacterium]